MSIPLISTLLPTYGSMIGNYTLTINGTFVNNISYVSIGGINASFTQLSSSTVLVTLPSSSIQGNVDVIVTDVNGSSSPVIFTYGGNYYLNSLYLNSNSSITAIGTDGNYNIYFLRQTSSSITLWVYNNTSLTQLSYTIPGSGTLAILDMMVTTDNYLYILYTLTSGSITYHIIQYPITYSPIALGSGTTLLVGNTCKKFVTNSTSSLIYLIGNTALHGIISITNFSTVSIFKTSVVFISGTYKNDGYLYCISSTNIYEMLISSMSSGFIPSSQQIITCPGTTFTPSLILYIYNGSDLNNNGFYISDSNGSGGTGIGDELGFSNGQIFQYVYTFNINGSISNSTPIASNLIIRGNSGSGNIYVTTGVTVITNDFSNVIIGSNIGQWIFKTNAIAYNINPSGYTNLYNGTGSTTTTGYLIKYYNPTFGSSTGGDPHLKCINGLIYNLPNDHKYFRLCQYCDKDNIFTVNCSTRFFTKDTNQLDFMEFVASQNGDHLEYWKDTVDNMYKNHQRYITIFEWTYLDKIYINYNGKELIIDMDTLSMTDSNCISFKIEDINNDKGIYSIFHNTYHKKTSYTKHKIITCVVDINKTISVLLDSDISIVDRHSFSLKFKGIDNDLLTGSILSEKSLTKIDSLSQIVI